jgi:hypothetical protein
MTKEGMKTLRVFAPRQGQSAVRGCSACHAATLSARIGERLHAGMTKEGMKTRWVFAPGREGIG